MEHMLEGRFCVFESAHALVSGQPLEKIKGQTLVGFPSRRGGNVLPEAPSQSNLLTTNQSVDSDSEKTL